MNEKTQAAYDLSADAAKVLLEVMLKAIPVALLYSLVLFGLSVVLIILMHRRKLYTREHKVWNVLTKLHYPAWMFILVSVGFALGLIASLQSSADRAIDEKLKPLLVQMAARIKQMVNDNLPPELADGPMTGQAIYDRLVEKATYDAMLEEKAGKDDDLFMKLGRKFENGVRQYLTKAAIDMAIVKSGEKIGLSEEQSEFSLETFKKIDFNAKADEMAGKVTEMAKKQVGGFANGMRVQCAMYAGIFLLLLLVEPLVYYKVVVPRKMKAQPPAVPASVIEAGE